MRLDQELVKRGLCESRTEAQELIGYGFVIVNGSTSRKQIQQVGEADVISVLQRRPFVSRGGEKLQGVFRDVYGEDESIRRHIEGKTAIDLGSSTGGFSDCLLSYGVIHIDAVDVGTAQLHDSLRKDKRVSLFEQTDMRGFSSETTYDIVVADLSFISLEAVLDTIIGFGGKGTGFFLLIKPQFEVGKGNTKKGIVKDEMLVVELLRKYEVLAKVKGLSNVQLFPCHLKGGDGNQEFFLVAKK